MDAAHVALVGDLHLTHVKTKRVDLGHALTDRVKRLVALDVEVTRHQVPQLQVVAFNLVAHGNDVHGFVDHAAGLEVH